MVRSLPGLGTILGARVLGEFGDEPNRYANAKSRKNYAGTSPIARASGTRKCQSGLLVPSVRESDRPETNAAEGYSVGAVSSRSFRHRWIRSYCSPPTSAMVAVG